MKLSIVIPVYNEINTILELLRQVKAVPIEKEIIIVDDCSTDGTREALIDIKENNIKVILNERNRGKGFSLRNGFQHVTGDIVIIQDADLEYYPDEYALLIQKITEGKADVVYGTRFMGARRVFHFYHYIGNTFLNFIANFLYDTNVSDLMTCYKAFKSDVIRSLALRANGFGIEAEITAQIFKRKLKVYEVPISYNGRDYDEGKKITWKDFFRSVYWLLKCRFESYDIGADTLYAMRLMKHNNAWAFKQIKPYLGNAILEVGAGIGNISKFLTPLKKNVTLIDVNADYLEYLRYRFIGNPKVKVLCHDIASRDLSALTPLKIDTIVCMNVLEHIEDDNLVLENFYNILEHNGYCIIMVPALKALYAPLDEKLGHFRRYDKKDLLPKLQANHFVVEKIYYYNLFSSLGWFVSGCLLRQKKVTASKVTILDKFIPLFEAIESKVTVPFGLSLVAVCKKT